MFSKPLFALAATLTLVAADWPQYRGPSHDGKSPEEMRAWPANGPQPLWKGPTTRGFSSFAVKDGRAVTLVARNVEGAEREVLVALDAATGKEVWSHAFSPTKYGDDGGNSGTPQNRGGDGPRSTPTIDGGRVYVLTADLVLASLSASDGEVVWERDLIKENDAQNIQWKNAAGPVIEGDLIFVAAGGSRNSLLGINKHNGQVVWSGESDKITHATPVPATIHGVRQVIFLTQKGLVSVKQEDGKVLWRHPFRYSVSTAASPVIADDVVYCSAGYGVGAGAYKIKKEGDEFTAEEMWRKPGNDLANHWSTPVYKDGYLYGMFQFKEYGTGPVKCVDIRTGQEKWSKEGFGPGNVILVGDELVALTDAGQLVRIEPKPSEYKEIARFQAVTGKCWSTPAFADGKIYVRSTKEGAAFDLSSKLAQK